MNVYVSICPPSMYISTHPSMNLLSISYIYKIYMCVYLNAIIFIHP